MRYLDTSVEVWEPYADASSQDPRDRSLYVRHMAMRKMMRTWSKPGPTAVLEHGANPGLVSHLVKDALDTIAKRAIADGKIVGAHKDRVAARSGSSDRITDLAMELGVKVIHVAERDTQISDKPKEVGEFVNTWSVEGLYEEGVAPAELGWGTHERRMPEGAYVHQSGPSHQTCLGPHGHGHLGAFAGRPSARFTAW